MIAFDPATRTFQITMATSQYLLRVDEHRRLEHVHWGPVPADHVPQPIAAVAPHPSGDVHWQRQSRRWELVAFGDVSQHEPTLKAHFPAVVKCKPDQEADHAPVRDLRLRYVGHDLNLAETTRDAKPGLSPEHGRPPADPSPRPTLRIEMADPVYDLRCTLCYRVTPEHDLLERWIELTNTGERPIDFDTVGWATWHVPSGANELTHVTGSWGREFQIQRRTLCDGAHPLESRQLMTGHCANPFFLLNRPGEACESHGPTWFGALAYSGNWRITVEQRPTGDLRVHGGYNPFDDAFTLAPGQTHTTPAFVGGVSCGGWGGASRRLHALTRERILPIAKDSSPLRPVLYNSWYATEFALTARQQIALAEKAAKIGVELFCVDDAWFGGRRSDRAGLGDWWVSPEVFPEGLTPLVRRVRELGMSFGLWFEPEMVNPDSQLYRSHPDWVLHFPGRPRSEVRNQLVLDFGRPEVIEHVYDAVDRVVRRYELDFIKWDMNRYPSEPGSVVGPTIWREHVRGLYGFMDRLRAEHPALTIETCAGGGGRIDLGVFARTDQAWVSDTVDPYDRLHIQEGFSLAYPPRTMVAWVTDRPTDDADLQRRFDVAMRGVLGIGSDLLNLTDAQLDKYRQQIAFYKTIRHVVQHGDLHRLERLERSGDDAASVWFSVLPDASQAVYSVALRDAQLGRVRSSRPLVGLDAAATYMVRDANGETVEQRSGYDLMSRGLPVEPMQMRGYTRTLHLIRQPPGPYANAAFDSRNPG